MSRLGNKRPHYGPYQPLCACARPFVVRGDLNGAFQHVGAIVVMPIGLDHEREKRALMNGVCRLVTDGVSQSLPRSTNLSNRGLPNARAS